MEAGHTIEHDEGFTLLELLIVIVILGVLATVVVFAVGGITDRGEVAALESDERTLETAEEAHRAQHGTYATESQLVAAGFLRAESDIHDIDYTPGESTYALVAEGTVTTTVAPETTVVTTTTVAEEPTDTPDETTTTVPAPPDAVPASYAGQSALSYGSGPKKLVIIGNGSGAAGAALWAQITSAQTALDAENTQVIWLSDVDSRADVDAILAANPTYVIVPIQVPLSDGGYAGQYISGLTIGGSPMTSPGRYWWGQQQGGVSGAIAYYLGHF